MTDIHRCHHNCPRPECIARRASISARLRDYKTYTWDGCDEYHLITSEAADHIDALTAELEKLKSDIAGALESLTTECMQNIDLTARVKELERECLANVAACRIRIGARSDEGLT